MTIDTVMPSKDTFHRKLFFGNVLLVLLILGVAGEGGIGLAADQEIGTQTGIATTQEPAETSTPVGPQDEPPAVNPHASPKISDEIDPLLSLEPQLLTEEQVLVLEARRAQIQSRIPGYHQQLQDLRASEADAGKRTIEERRIREEARLAIQQRIRIQKMLDRRKAILESPSPVSAP